MRKGDWDMTLDMKFTARLTEACEAAGVSGWGRQSDLMRKLNGMGNSFKPQSISRWFKGQVPKRSNVAKIAACLAVDPVWLETGRLGSGSDRAKNNEIGRMIELTPAMWNHIDEKVRDGIFQNESDYVRSVVRSSADWGSTTNAVQTSGDSRLAHA